MLIYIDKIIKKYVGISSIYSKSFTIETSQRKGVGIFPYPWMTILLIVLMRIVSRMSNRSGAKRCLPSKVIFYFFSHVSQETMFFHDCFHMRNISITGPAPRFLIQWGQPKCVIRGKICRKTTDYVPGHP